MEIFPPLWETTIPTAPVAWVMPAIEECLVPRPFWIPTELVSMALKSLWEGREAPRTYLERLGLAEAHSFKDLFVRRLFAGNL